MWAALLAGCLLAAAAVGSSGAARPKAIVLIVADDLGFNDVGFNGGEASTPVMDGLASDGVQLLSYYGHMICTPSRSAIQTGRYASHVGLQHSFIEYGTNVALPLKFDTLGNHFQRLNYSTHFVGKWHLGMASYKEVPWNRGYSTYYGYLGGGEDYYTHKAQGYLDLRSHIGPDFNQTGVYSAPLFANKTIDAIRSSNGRDLFIVLCFQSVHAPIQAPAEYVKPYAWVTNPHRRTMLGMITDMDTQVGRIRQALQDAQLWDDTVLALVADNGGPPYVANSNYPLRGGKWTIWEGGTHLAGFVFSKALPSKNFTGLMHHCDLGPTLVAAAGGTFADGAQPPPDGINMWDALMDPTAVAGPRTSALLNVDQTNQKVLNDPHGWSGYAGIRVGDWKLVLGAPGVPNGWCWPNQNSTTADVAPATAPGRAADAAWAATDGRAAVVNLEGTGWVPAGPSTPQERGWVASTATPEVQPPSCSYNGTVPNDRTAPRLYHLATDPRETINLASVNASVLAALRAELQTYIDSAVPPLNETPEQRQVDPASSPKAHGNAWTPWRP